MRFPVSLFGNNLIRSVLTKAWFSLLPYLICYLLPVLVLGSPLLSWPAALFLGMALGLILLPLLQKVAFLDPERLLNTSITFTMLSVLLLCLYLPLHAGLLLLYADRPSDQEKALFVFLLLALITAKPIMNRIQASIDRYLGHDRPDYHSLLCDISSTITTSLYLPDLLRVLTTDLPDRLMITRVGVLILHEQRSRLYPENLRIGSRLWSESRLVDLLRTRQYYRTCRTVSDDPQLSRELTEMRQAGFSLVYPLRGGTHFGGMLLLGGRRDGKQYSRRDIEVFVTLANQVNIALENAMNYESLAESKKQLQTVYDKLIHAEKMAALGELTTVLAHELKNPLGIIRGSAQYLSSSPRGPEMQQELLHYIMDEVDSLNLVITNLLGLARHKPPRFHQVDLRRELSDFIGHWQQSSEHNPAVEIILSLPNYPPVLYADRKQLRQVLLNCVANSEEVMPEGGTFKIAVQEVEAEQLEIILTDTGPGIAEEDLKLVFKKFFTTKEKGVGLGLPICRQIIRAHNGSIRVLNRIDGGVKVVIRLPLRPLVTVGQGMDRGDDTKAIIRRIWSSEY